MAARDGQRIASLYRQARNLREIRAPDLEALAEEDGIEICESALADPGYAAMLLCPDPSCGGIMLAPGQGPGRRRFSVAHEFGHYHMPRHKNKGREFKCLETDMRARDTDSRTLEWEANDFAADLLMASHLFGADAGKRDISFRSVEELASAEMYNVSMTAAAWRLVQTVRDRCALVVSVKGRVMWIARSRSFGLPLIERSQSVDPASLAAAAVRGEGVVGSAEPVPWHSWFGDERREEGCLLESTHIVGQLDQVLSLLWFVEGADDED